MYAEQKEIHIIEGLMVVLVEIDMYKIRCDLIFWWPGQLGDAMKRRAFAKKPVPTDVDVFFIILMPW